MAHFSIPNSIPISSLSILATYDTVSNFFFSFYLVRLVPWYCSLSYVLIILLFFHFLLWQAWFFSNGNLVLYSDIIHKFVVLLGDFLCWCHWFVWLLRSSFVYLTKQQQHSQDNDFVRYTGNQEITSRSWHPDLLPGSHIVLCFNLTFLS